MRLSALLLTLLFAVAAHAQGLALRRVMLSTGGVGYFEYEGTADGATPLTLDVPRAQVDDVLASLVVFDAAGHVGGVTLPGEDADRAAFADLPFDRAALDSPRDLLNALQGQPVTVRGPRPMTGRLLRAETVTEPSGTQGGIPRTRVTLLTEAGVQQFVLEDADSVHLADPSLRTRLDRALAALRGQSAADLRRLTLRLPGQGQRTVRVGYVAAAPLWKATYRLLLPAAGTPARLQGWAVLENYSATDWNGIELALQYGNPVTFRQALYRAYYVARPEVPVEMLGRLLPGIDTRARAFAAAAAPLAAAAPPPMAAPEAPPVATEAVQSTVFRLPMPVTLPAGQTATVPILDRAVPAARVDLLTQGQAHPLAAVRLTNDGQTSLPAGILTLYDGADAAAFAGDARLGGLPPGESRLLAFAEDLRTAAEWHFSTGMQLTSVTAAGGVLHLQRRDRWTARITLQAPADAPRTVLLEIAKRPGTIGTDDGTAPAEETATAWRFSLALHAGETRTFTVHVDRTLQEAVALLQDEAAVVRVLADQGLSPAARAALQHVADLRTALAARRADAARLAARRTDVERDEVRLRQNLAVVPAADALHGRLIATLAADESQLADLAARRQTADQAVAAADAALQQAVHNLSL